jgi:hypothetical protein
MNLNQTQLQPEFEMEYYNGREQDIRRDPNHVLLLFFILIGLFVLALTAIYVTKGQGDFFG